MVKVGCTPRCLPGMCPQIRQPQAKVLWTAEVNILMPSLKLPHLGAHMQGTFEKHPQFGGSCPPLEASAQYLISIRRKSRLFGCIVVYLLVSLPGGMDWQRAIC